MCQSHIFILNPWIGPQAFRHTNCTLGKNVLFLMWKSVQFKVPEFSILGPLSKIDL
jgi:hypothetical protein